MAASSTRPQVCETLRALLANGPVDSAVATQAIGAGERTLRRVRRELGVLAEARRDRNGRVVGWTWTLPDERLSSVRPGGHINNGTAEPAGVSLAERLALVANRLKEIDPTSAAGVEAKAVVGGVRKRSHLHQGPVPLGLFQAHELEQLVAIVDRGPGGQLTTTRKEQAR